MKAANLTINVEKSHFCFKELKYLGYIVGQGVLRPDPSKVSCIKDFPLPTSQKQVRRFLGMCGWYRRFIRNFAAIASHLTDTLKKGKKFELGSEAKESFEALKTALISAPLLSHPEFERKKETKR